MEGFVERLSGFQAEDFPRQRELYLRLARHGQSPKVLVISCSDSRVVPEFITRSDPGEIFVCRNAGNVVPPHQPGAADAVSCAIEYAVVGLGVTNIVVFGHSDCGAMKAVLHPEHLQEMPAVAAWLGHCRCARGVYRVAHDGMRSDEEAARIMAMENVAAQLTHLKTHPCVAARIAAGELTLHGWFFDIASGTVFALDGATRRFDEVAEDAPLPIALPSGRRAVSIARTFFAAA